MYRTRQAAKYVGMKFVTFVYHVQEGHVKEDLRVKGERVFRKETLDVFQQKYRSETGMTRDDIAERYGQPVPVVRGHLRRQNLEPIAKTGRKHVYKTEDVELMARQLGWGQEALGENVDAVTS